ncbi:MAG: FtsW/RodA/SpoVE family cell cycle protein [Clostridia bacterium]|nr:FtsW/RodA/SpoVE family cell cycle protein [Clostridia bacterium]
MREFSVTLKEKIRKIDYVVFFCVLGMNLLSILTLYGASSKFGTRFFIMQTAMSVAGIFMMFAMSYFDYDKIIKAIGIWKPMLAAAILMSLIFILGDNRRGNTNWIYIPFINLGIQPSEFVKILYIVTFSQHIKRVKNDINNFKNVIALAAHAMFYCAIIIIPTSDLGSTLVFMGMTIIMLLVGGLSMWYFIGIFGAIFILSPFLWEFLSETQQNRIIFGFNPEGDPQGKGFQALCSRKAIAAGGFLGAGLFGGTQYNFTDSYSDFLFAVLAEKFGFFGCFLYIVLMAVLVIRVLWIARIARKDYGAYMCAGVVGVLMCQSLENIGMCLAMLPVVGITLPFFSYGGSSMVASYMMIGLVQSIKSHNQKYFFEREKS